MTDHEKSHEELLERLFQDGEISPGERAMLESDETSAAALRELEGVVAYLDSEGAKERSSILAEASSAPEPPGADKSRLALQQAMGSSDSRSVLPWLVLTAAALALGVLGWRMLIQPQSNTEPIFVSEGGVELKHPIGLVQEYSPFQWSYDESFTGTFDLLIWDAGDESFEPRIEIEDLEGSTWTNTDEIIPERIEWQIRVKDDSGNVVTVSSRISASR